MKLLDIIDRLNNGETLSITKNALMVDFTLSKKLDIEGGVVKTMESTSSMPPDHHCDLERVDDVVQFLQKRINESEQL